MNRPRVSNAVLLVLRFLGAVTVLVEDLGGRIRVTLPGGIITVADDTAALDLYRAWSEAAEYARQAFLGAPKMSSHLYDRPAQQVLASVMLTGRQLGITVQAQRPANSPSKCGQVAVRIGTVTIICDDLTSFDSLYQAWQDVYRIAETLWEMPNADHVRHRAEARARNETRDDG